jgi:uncharacterized PurR-regulated membrane protein YhhQ (DUF165 family)
MPFDIQISLQKLLTGLIVVIVPLSVVGLYLTSNADSSLQQTVGMYFRTMAQTEAASTSQFISGRIVDVQAVAGYPKYLAGGSHCWFFFAVFAFGELIVYGLDTMASLSGRYP